MKTLEPRRVEIAETYIWLKEALELISRRLVPFILSVVIFISLIYVAIRAFVTIVPSLPSAVSLSLFLFYCAFVLFVVLTDMVVLAFLSDNSRAANIGERARTLMPEQKTLLILSVKALLVGATIWVLFLTVNPNKDFFITCDQVIARMMLDKDNPIFFIFQLTATVLYFLVLSLIGLRTFFSIPLVIFHDLTYREAKLLSHKAIIINIQPMSMALITWILMFMVAISAVNVLSLILFPLFAAYVYVSYRHIFIGQLENDKAKAITKPQSAHAFSEK
jgi:hypothetical protein